MSRLAFLDNVFYTLNSRTNKQNTVTTARLNN